MVDDLLKSYPHAMTIDPDTGKPMLMVQVQGGSGGGSEVVFPDDYPDKTAQETLENIEHYLENIAIQLNDIVNGNVTISVKIEEPEPEPED